MIGRILCFFGRHAYVTTQLFGDSRRVTCARCGRMFAMSDQLKIITPWDADFHRMYERHGHRINYKDWEGE